MKSATPDSVVLVTNLTQRGRLVSGLFALLLILWSLLMLSLLHPYPFDHNFPRQIDSPVLALELPSNAQDLQAVFPLDNADTNKARHVLKTNNTLDLILIPLCAAFLWFFVSTFNVGSGLLHLQRLCLATIVGAAIFDYVEDFGIFRALASQELTDKVALRISLPSHLKWALFGSALLLIAIILFRSADYVYSRATLRIQGLLFAVAGLLVLIGLRAPSKIELGTNIFAICVFWNAVGFLGPDLALRFQGIRPVYIQDFCEKRRAEGTTSVMAAPAEPTDDMSVNEKK